VNDSIAGTEIMRRHLRDFDSGWLSGDALAVDAGMIRW
jgi:hypothetical protein